MQRYYREIRAARSGPRESGGGYRTRSGPYRNNSKSQEPREDAVTENLKIMVLGKGIIHPASSLTIAGRIISADRIFESRIAGDVDIGGKSGNPCTRYYQAIAPISGEKCHLRFEITRTDSWNQEPPAALSLSWGKTRSFCLKEQTPKERKLFGLHLGLGIHCWALPKSYWCSGRRSRSSCLGTVLFDYTNWSSLERCFADPYPETSWQQ